MPKVLLVGEASREHAIADALARSGREPRIYAVMKNVNPGIARICERTRGSVYRAPFTDPRAVLEAASKFSVDLVFVGPEEPLFRGVADALVEAGFPVVGALRAAAEIEMSKAFMRRLMWKYGIPGRLRFKAFKSVEDAVAYISAYAESIALKPARQAGGKGVKVIADLQAYLSKEKQEVKSKHAKVIHDKHMAEYTDIEDRILIEERVEGPEYTLQTFTDGRTVKPLPLVQDNKNAFEMDIGPETGGMGSIAGPGMTLPFITMEEFERSVEIVKSVVDALWRETGVRYKGIISGQMMLTPLWGPTIIEFYSRLGDPEACNVLPILKTDLLEVAEAIVSESLHKVDLEFEGVATVVKAVAPRGYPDHRDLAKGHPVYIDEEAIAKRGCLVYYGSVDLTDGGVMLTGGSRVAEIVAMAEDIPKASELAEGCVPYVKLLDGWGLFHRSDIGSPTLLRRRVEQAELVREIYKYRASKGLIGRAIDWIPGRGKVETEF
ncbi:MAG: phosphoribosylamine--glycine ligase [Candidatus Nezhaarchaeales archaeon]